MGMSQIPIGWLMKKEGFETTPRKQQVSMMIDGIPAPGPSMFTKRTLLAKPLLLNDKINIILDLYSSNGYELLIYGTWYLINGHATGTDSCFEVPIPHIFGLFVEAYVRGYTPKIWPEKWYSTSILGSWNDHW